MRLMALFTVGLGFLWALAAVLCAVQNVQALPGNWGSAVGVLSFFVLITPAIICWAIGMCLFQSWQNSLAIGKLKQNIRKMAPGDKNTTRQRVALQNLGG